MDIPKAKELIKLDLNKLSRFQDQDLRSAHRTGLEALERIEVGRNNPGTYWNDPLPSEREGVVNEPE